MKDNLFIKNNVVISGDELEISTSRAGGPGGQHVNKTNTRVTVRWNAKNTNSLSNPQKEQVLKNLETSLTIDGDLIVHNSASRSQQQNKDLALVSLAQKVRKALYVPKKRMKTRVPKNINESRLQAKKHRSTIKKLRGKTD